MSITMEEAVAALRSDGPAVTDQIQRMTHDTLELQDRVHGYEGALHALHFGLTEQQAALSSATKTLEETLVACERQLESEMSETDSVVLGLQRFMGLTQSELQIQMEAAFGKLENLRAQIDQLPPVLQQAVVHQSEAFGKTQRAIDSATDTLSHTVSKTVAEYEGLKGGVVSNQKLVAGQVSTLVAQVKQVQSRTHLHTESLVANSNTVVNTFQTNLHSTFSTTVHQPGEQMKSGLENLTKHTQAELEKSLNFLVHEGLNRALGGLQKIAQRNGSIIADLKRLVPEGLSQGARSLAHVIQNLDTILKVLAKRAVNWLTGILDAGLDWVSQKTGINLDFLKNSIKAVGGVVLAGIDLAAGQIRMAKTLVTNPANLGRDIQSLIQDARGAATAVGHLVGI